MLHLHNIAVQQYHYSIYLYILPFEYEQIYDFYVISESEGVVFSAKRSDGVYIVGKVGINGGSVQIIEEGTKVTKLVKITN